MTGYCQLCKLRLESTLPLVGAPGAERETTEALMLGQLALEHLRTSHGRDFQTVVQGLATIQAFVGLALLEAPPAAGAAGQPALELQRDLLRAQLLDWLGSAQLFGVRQVTPAAPAGGGHVSD